jgi:hypothetical protein
MDRLVDRVWASVASSAAGLRDAAAADAIPGSSARAATTSLSSSTALRSSQQPTRPGPASVNKRFLAGTIRSTEVHNRAQEVAECWAERAADEQLSALETRPQRGGRGAGDASDMGAADHSLRSRPIGSSGSGGGTTAGCPEQPAASAYDATALLAQREYWAERKRRAAETTRRDGAELGNADAAALAPPLAAAGLVGTAAGRDIRRGSGSRGVSDRASRDSSRRERRHDARSSEVSTSASPTSSSSSSFSSSSCSSPTSRSANRRGRAQRERRRSTSSSSGSVRSGYGRSSRSRHSRREDSRSRSRSKDRRRRHSHQRGHRRHGHGHRREKACPGPRK